MFLLAIIAPPEPGLEIGGSLGGGKYRDVSCAGPTYYYREQTYAANVRFRTDIGATVAADVSQSIGAPAGDGPQRDAFSISSRVGWHFLYGGFEGGIGALRRADHTDAVPSGLAWIGVPEFHAFGTLLADRYAVNQPDFKFGLGGLVGPLAIDVGAGVQGFSTDLEVRTWKHFAPTLSFRVNGHDDWNVAAGLTFRVAP